MLRDELGDVSITIERKDVKLERAELSTQRAEEHATKQVEAAQSQVLSAPSQNAMDAVLERFDAEAAAAFGSYKWPKGRERWWALAQLNHPRSRGAERGHRIEQLAVTEFRTTEPKPLTIKREPDACRGLKLQLRARVA